MQREKCLGLLPNSFQNLINQYCTRIEECDADCFVVVARKAVCFLESLIQEGLLNITINNKPIYSSNCLDFLDNDFSQKKIAVIDDLSNSGAAIAEITNTLIDRFRVPPTRIEIIVLAVNRDTFSMNFTDVNTGYSLLNCNHVYKLNNADCAELSKTIASTLCSLGIPYDSDFPTYEITAVTDQQYRNLLSTLFWDCYNVSNQYHKKSGVNALVLRPKPSIENEVFKFMGIDLCKGVHLKVRLLTNRSDAGTWTLRVVPMAIIRESYVSNILQICNAITALNATVIGKFRFLQFYIAAALGQIFWSKEPELSTPRMNPTCCTNVFGAIGNDKFAPHFFEDSLNSNRHFKDLVYVTWNSFSNEDGNADGCKQNGQSETDIPDNMINFVLNEKLSKPIISWFINKEQPIRKQIWENNLNYRTYNRGEGNKANLFKRLSLGYPFSFFERELKNFNNSYHTSNLVSVFLDRAIDLGFIVPTIFEDGNTIYRAFRHGEGSQGIESDFIYLKNFIILFKEYVRKKDPSFRKISSIDFEKIVVLFYKFASQEGLINYFMKFDNGCFLVEQYSLHGAIMVEREFPQFVPSEFSFHPYSEDDNYTLWLSKKLLNMDFISTLDFESGPYEIRDIEPDKNSITAKNYKKIEMLALLFAEWYSTYNQPNLRNDFRNSAIKLTSCESLDAISTSILVEIQYCIRNWYGDIAKAKEESFDTLLAYLQVEIIQSKSFRGLNSGIQKFKFYMMHEENSPILLDGQFVMFSTIQEVAEKLSAVNPMYEVFWNKQWGDYLSSKPSVNGELERLLIESANYLFYFSAIYRSLHVVAVGISDITQIADLSDLHRETFSELNSLFDIGLYQHCRDIICSPDTQREKIGKLMSLFQDLVADAEKHRNAVEKQLSPKVYDFPERYNGCIIINIYNDDCSLCKSILHDVTSKRKCYNELLAVEEVVVENKIWNNRNLQRFYLFSNSENNLPLLLQAANMIHLGIREHDINDSYILIPSFPEGEEYEYRVCRNTQVANRLLRRSIVNKIDGVLENFYYGLAIVSPARQIVQDIGYFEQSDVDIAEEMLQNNIKNFSTDIKLFENEDYSMEAYSTETKKIGIVTVRPDETSAVMKELNMKQQSKGNYTYYYSEELKNNILYQFYLRRQLEKGNTYASNAIKQLASDWNIDFAVLLGVAGTLKPNEAGLCDVVIADKIIDITYGAETDGGYTPQANMPEIDVRLVEWIHDFETQIFGKAFPNSDDLPKGKTTFKVAVGPIGNSGHVIKSEQAESREILQKHINSSVLAVETEAAGFAAAIRNLRLLGSSIVGPIIIRGISDGANVDKDKNDTYHLTASKNAAAILHEILPYIVERESN